MRHFLANPSSPSRLYGYQWEDGFIAPFVPCDVGILDDALEFLQPRTEQLVLDLGCGDGLVLRRAVLKCGCKARGVELDADLVRQARDATLSLPEHLHERVEVIQGDMFEPSLWGDVVDFVILYLLPGGLRKLGPLLEPLLRQGKCICTLSWEFPEWDKWCLSSKPGHWHVYQKK